MDSDPEDHTASSRGRGIANTQCCTSSPLPLLTLFPSFPVAFFPFLTDFTYFKFIPLRFVEVSEGSERSYSEDIDLSELSPSACLLPSHSCQNPYSVPHAPLGGK